MLFLFTFKSGYVSNRRPSPHPDHGRFLSMFLPWWKRNTDEVYFYRRQLELVLKRSAYVAITLWWADFFRKTLVIWLSRLPWFGNYPASWNAHHSPSLSSSWIYRALEFQIFIGTKGTSFNFSIRFCSSSVLHVLTFALMGLPGRLKELIYHTKKKTNADH